MHGKRILLIVAATIPAFLPAPAHACTIVYQPFSSHLERADGRTLAIRATPTIRFTAHSDEHWAGTVTFENIRCLKRPRGMTCPAQLQVSFDEHFDGASCPSVLSEDPRPGTSSRLRYFMFRPDDGGQLVLRLAARRLDR